MKLDDADVVNRLRQTIFAMNKARQKGIQKFRDIVKLRQILICTIATLKN